MCDCIISGWRQSWPLRMLVESCGPCPHCGAAAERYEFIRYGRWPWRYALGCTQCDATGPKALNLEYAVKAWRDSTP